MFASAGKAGREVNNSALLSSVSPIRDNRLEDEIDRRLIARAWRATTEPMERRAERFDTSATAAFGWLYIDRFREWQRHRGTPSFLS